MFTMQDMMVGSVSGLNSFDETALVGPAVRVIQGNWLKDVSHYQNVYADYQIIHLNYRWLR